MKTNLDTVMELEKAFLGAVQDDISHLTQYERKKADLVNIDILSGPMLMQDFLFAYEEATKISTKYRNALENAETELKHEAAKAVLERAPDYFRNNEDKLGKIKDSKSLRDSYLYLDEIYLQTQEKVAALRAIVRLMDNKAESFKMAHDDAKKVYSQLLGGPGAQSGYNGLPSGGNIGDNDGRK